MGSITIKDVAKHAGVSIATVSRVINQNYYVNPEIEEKVLLSIKELNYYPNSVARSLKNSSTYIIGFVVSDISNSYFTAIAKSLEEVIDKENYNIIVCSTENKKEREKAYLELLLGKKVDGLVINTTGKNDEFISQVSKSVPTVLINRRINSSNFKGDFIDSNSFEGGYMLASHLLALGHKKIGVINGDLSVSTGYERFSGFTKAMAEAGINVDNRYPYRYDGDFTTESGYQGVANLLKGTDKPTAVIAMNNSMMLGTLKYTKVHGIRIPQDISIASYGDIKNVELMYVQPTIVSESPWKIGRKGGELLLERIKNIELENREIVFTPQLIIGTGVNAL